MSNLASVRKLDESVVNRIAAGEVIQRPANALKELIENSLDAGSTQIQILIKDGGLKLLQIQDNGHGIRKDDMAIVCERFTTSKLSTFADLSTIATHGFRGEALASISCVAHVTITTKTADSACAYRALYSNGSLVPARPGQSAEPKACAGNNGTQITAEDLFYNTPTRIKALKSPSDEYNRILDIVTRYAVHNAGVSFTCRKQGANMSDIQTTTGASIVDNIRTLYGAVASELLPVDKDFENLKFKMKGYISNANYSVKRMTFLLFINNRAVESSNIKRAIDSVYSSLLPKGGYPFIYLSLEIDPKNVDVNVHPTKKEVHFLNEDKIIDAVIDIFQATLENANHSRTFLVQSLLPGASAPRSPDEDDFVQDKRSSGNNNGKPVAEYRYVRTDSTHSTMHRFLDTNPTKRIPTDENDNRMDIDHEEENRVITEPQQLDIIKRPRVEVRLGSVLQLRKEIKKEENQDLTSIFSNHTFIACIDDVFALIQYEQNIYVVNYNVASEELFYQVVLNEFCNMGQLRLSTPISIKACVLVAIEIEAAKGNVPDDLKSPEEIAVSITDLLVSRSEMLLEYFSMEITSQGDLVALPMLVQKYVPCMDKLPLFLLRLGTEVDWETEKGCFATLSREMAILYSAESPANQSERQEYLWKVEHLVFPSFKTYYLAPTTLKSFVTRIANLRDLYKIFERC